PNVFDRFYRADTAREFKGSSGLGLAIAKQIVEGLGGRIWAISEIEQGASIIVSLKKTKDGKH
ncbi:MAG: ATP-binding protein, partial [Tissierellia bacterium]|nr:ATP-binding protein [Tissierellia bacterium]